MVCSTDESKAGVGGDMTTRLLSQLGSRAVRVDLHHGEGEGDDHGGVEPLREPNGNDQDSSQGEATDDAVSHLRAPGGGPWGRNQLTPIDPLFLDQAVRCVAHLHHGTAAILHDHGRPVTGLST